MGKGDPKSRWLQLPERTKVCCGSPAACTCIIFWGAHRDGQEEQIQRYSGQGSWEIVEPEGRGGVRVTPRFDR